MSKKDPYASEAETQALLVPDTRTAAERKLDQIMAERGADEQGAEDYLILRQIALDLLAEQPAQQEPVAWGWAIMHSDGTYAWIRPRIADFFGSTQEREPYTSEDAKHADREWAGLAPHTIVTLYTSPQPAQQVPVGEIGKVVMFGGDLKEVSWKNGKMPPVGSILYTHPQARKPEQRELCPSCRSGSIYACTCTTKPAQQEPVTHCEAGPEFCQQCNKEEKIIQPGTYTFDQIKEMTGISIDYTPKTFKYSGDPEPLALKAALGYIERHTPYLVYSVVRDALAEQPAKREPDHTELLRMIASRARSFPSFPMGYHLPEVFDAVGETPPASKPAQQEPLVDDMETLRAVSDEYNAWIRAHASGMGYDEFLKQRLAAHNIKEQP